VIVPIAVVDIKFDFTNIDHDYTITIIGEKHLHKNNAGSGSATSTNFQPKNHFTSWDERANLNQKATGL
jgi:hypothetical protein